MEHNPSDILRGMRVKVDVSLPIFGVSTGIEATCEDVANVDFIAVRSSDQFQAAATDSLGGFLAYGNANDVVREMIPSVVKLFPRVPILAGVCGVDPFLLRSHYLDELRALGIAGIQNYPTVGLIDGHFRKNLEDTGMSFSLEVECIAEAHAMGLFTAPFVFDADQARGMLDAGADLLIAHPGLLSDRSGPSRPNRLRQECLDKLRRITEAAKRHRPDVLVVCNSASLGETESFQSLQRECPEIIGFFETRSITRLTREPTEPPKPDSAPAQILSTSNQERTSTGRAERLSGYRAVPSHEGRLEDSSATSTVGP